MQTSESSVVNIQQWALEHDIVAIYFHGSRAEGCARPDSDADVAVLIDRDEPDWEKKEEWAEQLADLLAPQLEVRPNQVDIQFLNTAPLAFQFRVIRNRKLLWEAQDYRRATFETRLLSEYLDYCYYEEIHNAAMRERLREGHYGNRPAFYRTAS